MTGHQLGHIPITGNTIPRTKIDFCTRRDVDPYSVIDTPRCHTDAIKIGIATSYKSFIRNNVFGDSVSFVFCRCFEILA